MNIEKERIEKALFWALAYSYSNANNYFEFILSITLMILGYKEKPPAMTCSGFVATCLSKVGYYFRNDKVPSRITPQDILTSF